MLLYRKTFTSLSILLFFTLQLYTMETEDSKSLESGSKCHKKNKLGTNKIPPIFTSNKTFSDRFETIQQSITQLEGPPSNEMLDWSLAILPKEKLEEDVYKERKKRVITFLCALKKKKISKDMKNYLLPFLPPDSIYNQHLFDLIVPKYLEQPVPSLALLPVPMITSFEKKYPEKIEEIGWCKYRKIFSTLATQLHLKTMRSLIYPETTITFIDVVESAFINLEKKATVELDSEKPSPYSSYLFRKYWERLKGIDIHDTVG